MHFLSIKPLRTNVSWESTNCEWYSTHLVHLNKAGASDGLADRCHQTSAFVGELCFTMFDLSKITLLTPILSRILVAHTSSENVSLSKKSLRSASLHSTG